MHCHWHHTCTLLTVKSQDLVKITSHLFDSVTIVTTTMVELIKNDKAKRTVIVVSSTRAIIFTKISRIDSSIKRSSSSNTSGSCNSSCIRYLVISGTPMVVYEMSTWIETMLVLSTTRLTLSACPPASMPLINYKKQADIDDHTLTCRPHYRHGCTPRRLHTHIWPFPVHQWVRWPVHVMRC